ncbi:MAG: hypothetical protein ACP5RZ_02885 [Thermoplasmata archaeon]
MQIKKLAFLSTLLGILVPILVVATVVITYEYPLAFGSTTPDIYLAQGPNYAEASEMGLISLTNSTSNGIMQQTITIKNVTGSDSVYLLNVLEIWNKTGWDTSKGAVYVLINVSGLTNVAVIASTSPINWPTSGTNITQNNPFYYHIPKTTTSGPVLYISLDLWSGSNSASTVTYSGTIYITYYVEPAGSTYTP